ncbi:hypothetical protein CcCBS67573_g10220 [Chytriomyces confervae]|uniref:Tc1-like transposase DDE domain-containing protein n=1 Tax=Chytriomyces confervae TaxID=246404 RepID=A0A507D914_9FUNG|nr:hypothetical protein CcCBS67573_g10220 [Chytriomyces confervae]
MDVLAVVSGSHASPQVKAYCMYMHFYLGLSKARLAEQFHKSAPCIGEWVAAYKRGEDLSWKQKANARRKFGVGRRKWLVDLYKARPVLLLEEAKKLFQARFSTSISVNGLLEASMTEGTFDRAKFSYHYKEFCTRSGHVYEYPGPCSVHILDGAKIHCSAELICFLRSLGIIPIFLPAYSPFFSPIEIVFGLMKKLLQHHYVQNSKRDLAMVVSEVLQLYVNRSFHKIFASCRFTVSGFDPGVEFNVPLAEFGFDKAENGE